jgi:hypothetical protein
MICGKCLSHIVTLNKNLGKCLYQRIRLKAVLSAHVVLWLEPKDETKNGQILYIISEARTLPL